MTGPWRPYWSRGLRAWTVRRTEPFLAYLTDGVNAAPKPFTSNAAAFRAADGANQRRVKQ